MPAAPPRRPRNPRKGAAARPCPTVEALRQLYAPLKRAYPAPPAPPRSLGGQVDGTITRLYPRNAAGTFTQLDAVAAVRDMMGTLPEDATIVEQTMAFLESGSVRITLAYRLAFAGDELLPARTLPRPMQESGDARPAFADLARVPDEAELDQDEDEHAR